MPENDDKYVKLQSKKQKILFCYRVCREAKYYSHKYDNIERLEIVTDFSEECMKQFFTERDFLLFESCATEKDVQVLNVVSGLFGNRIYYSSQEFIYFEE